MASSESYQLELISPDSPVAETILVAENSPRMAYYRVAIYYLPGAGYRVTKTSGASGARGNQEDYWRPNLKLALDKKAKLLAAKLRKRRGPRQYVRVGLSGIKEEL